MRNPVSLFLLLILTWITGIAQEANEHYLEINGSLWSGNSVYADYLEVIVNFNGKQYIATFTEANHPYLFPLEKST